MLKERRDSNLELVPVSLGEDLILEPLSSPVPVSIAKLSDRRNPGSSILVEALDRDPLLVPEVLGLVALAGFVRPHPRTRT